MCTNTNKFLIYQRRDSYGYIDFIRGAWRTHQDAFYHLTMMTPQEKDRVCMFSFDKLWDDLWVYRSSNFSKSFFMEAKKKFENLKTSGVFELLVQQSRVSTAMNLSWGLPKGKTEIGESAVECALREFKEEVNVYRSINSFKSPEEKAVFDIEMWKCGPILETFQGTDGKIYSTYYYLATCQHEFPLVKITLRNTIRGMSLSEEASDAKWVSTAEAGEYLNPGQHYLLEKAFDIIGNDRCHEHEPPQPSQPPQQPPQPPPKIIATSL